MQTMALYVKDRPETIPSHAGKLKPFLKWAGGKTQLLQQLEMLFPPELEVGRIQRYVEPFVGAGAVLFFIAQNCAVSEFVIADVNEELVCAYATIQRDVTSLIAILETMELEYHNLNIEQQADYYYNVRVDFNADREMADLGNRCGEGLTRTAQFLFLNRTCFNGLFRVNARGKFNVPFGRYKNPAICSATNLRQVAALLQSTTIQQCDFEQCERYIDANTFVYFDPPYRPINRTSSFTAYSANAFDDNEQMRLADFFKAMDKRGAKLMLSNSDPRNENPDDDFFDRLYAGYRIERVFASRMINCNAEKRGKINEIVVTNY